MFRVNFPAKTFESQGVKRVLREVKNLLDNPGATLAVCGDIGAGKTTAVFHALGRYEEHGDHIIWIQHPDREHLSVGTIMSAMVRCLGESPRRDVDVRTEQLRRLLGTKSQSAPVCVVVDDAQALPRATLRAFKRLLELNFGMRKGLFSLLLVGTSELESKLQTVPEKHWRCRFFDLKPLTQEEAKGYVLWVAAWGPVKLDDEAAAALSRQYRNPLAIASIVAGVQDQADHAGEKRVTADIIKSWLQASLRRQLDVSETSQRELARELKWSTAKVSRVIAGDYPNSQSEQSKLLAGLARIRAGARVPSEMGAS